jgi:hypothetical protein
MPLFLIGFVGYRLLRKPCVRQRKIRAVAFKRLGIHSDPATWTRATAEPIVDRFGFQERTTAEFVQSSQELLLKGQQEEALLTARLSLAFVDNDDPQAEDILSAEQITDQVLEQMASHPDD